MRREMRQIHRALAEKNGMSVLYVPHAQREAFEMATWIVILNEGKIAQQGRPEAIRNEPTPGFVQEFLSEN